MLAAWLAGPSSAACTRARRSPVASGPTCSTPARARACEPSWSPSGTRSARRARAFSWRRATRSGSSATASSSTPGSSSGSFGRGGWRRRSICATASCCRDSTTEWVYEAREAHRHRLGDVLERLAADAEAAGALKDAVRISRRRVELDPLREDAHRELIRRLIAAGEVVRRARGLRRPRSPPADRAAACRPRERPVACSRPFTRTRALRVGGAEPRRRFPRRWRGESAARSSAARTRSAGFGPSGPMHGDGSGRLAVIAGDPGIGKTRLASELARAAHAEGAAVLLGRCHEELLISYQPFVEAFGRYVAAVSPEVLRGQVGAHGGELGAARSRARPATPGPRRAGQRRLGGPALPPVRGRRRRCSRTRRDRGRSCWCSRTCTGRTSRPPCS